MFDTDIRAPLPFQGVDAHRPRWPDVWVEDACLKAGGGRGARVVGRELEAVAVVVVSVCVLVYYCQASHRHDTSLVPFEPQ
jgi:hypothetical protein